MTFMSVLRTLSRDLFGFLLACLVAGLVQVLYVSSPIELAAAPAGELTGRTASVLELALLAATHSAIFSAAFALIIAGIFEWLSLRTIAHSLAAGMGIALLGFVAQYSSEVSGQPTIFNNYALQAYLTAGFFAGLTYWMVAGRYAGSRREALAGGAAPVEAQEPAKNRVLVEKASGEVKKGSLAERLANRKASLAASAASVMTSVPVIKGKTAAGKMPDGDAAPPEKKPAPAAAASPDAASAAVPAVAAKGRAPTVPRPEPAKSDDGNKSSA